MVNVLGAVLRRIRCGRSAVLSLSLVVAVCGAPALATAAPIIDIAGSTGGCWGTSAGCSSFLTSTSLMGVTFDQQSFHESVDFAGSAPTDFGIGSFTRSQQSDFIDSNAFTLDVTFSLPAGIGGTTFNATISGNATGSGGPTIFDFDNTLQLFAFSNSLGSGSFLFGVIDPLQLTRGQTVSLFGTIQNMQFTPANSIPVPVPEPASMLLTGTGLLMTARWASRRRRRR